MKHSLLKKLAALTVALVALGALTGCVATPPAATNTPVATDTSAQAAAAGTTATVDAAQATDALKVFDAAELAKYDGQNGNPAYVAVDGKVYDVSNVPAWRGGVHAGGSVKAGLDQTEALKRSPHGAKNLEGLPVVGTSQ